MKEWPFWGFVIWFGADAHGELFRQSLEKRAYIVEPPHISNLNGSVKNKSEIETHGGVYGYGSVEEED